MIISAFIDASPLISFFKIERFDLLEIIGTPLACTDFVAAEVIHPRKPLEKALIHKQIVEIPTVDLKVLKDVEHLYTQGLGRGEASSILAAKGHRCSLVLDDKKARKIASKKKISLFSTADIIVQNIKADVLTVSEADTFIAKWYSIGEFPVAVKTFDSLMN